MTPDPTPDPWEHVLAQFKTERTPPTPTEASTPTPSGWAGLLAALNKDRT